jgi:membrane-bound lytic murein transglycosylase D
MRIMRAVLPAIALVTAACATTPSPKVVTPQSASADEIQQLRVSLEEAQERILAREEHRSVAPEADVRAAASIDIPDHRTIRGALDYFTTGLRESIQTSLLRSARYKKMIDAALDEADLPSGLGYLPVIESAYVNRLTSRAGAHGMWQFMPETASEYGLRVDWWIDERADPELATRAAAQFLKDLHRQFDDWPLALAAYNCGAGRVRRALKDTGASTFWELLEMSALPKETRGYVPTFFATLMIASDPATYGFRLVEPHDPDYEAVQVEGPVSIKYLAEVTSVDETVLGELNPSLRRGMVPPGVHPVRVPAPAAPVVAERARTLKNDDANIRVCSFKLRGGETVQKLARKLDTDAETILAMNGLSTSARLRAGQSIYLPVRARELGTLLDHSDDRTVFYAVRKGDTLYSIAKRHSLTVAELREINDLRNNTLHTGQKLRVARTRGVTAGGM